MVAPALPSVTDVPSWALSPRVPQRIGIAPPQCALVVPPAPVPRRVGGSARRLVALGGDTVPAATVPPAARPRAQRQALGAPLLHPLAQELLAELPGLRFATEGRGKVCVRRHPVSPPSWVAPGDTGWPWHRPAGALPWLAREGWAPPAPAPAPTTGRAHGTHQGKIKFIFFISHSTRKR